MTISRVIQSYVNGAWILPSDVCRPVVNPATGKEIAQVSMGTADTVNSAVQAARAAFVEFSDWTVEARIALLERISAAYEKRIPDLAEAITAEMGSPISFSRAVQAASPLKHFAEMIAVLKKYRFESEIGEFSILRREPVGVCGLITAWNWPVTLIATKVAPALAAGCTTILKPSEYTPISAGIVVEILDGAGVPAGVFNLINGDGPTVGAAMSKHPGIDLISLTGSKRAGQAVMEDAGETIKRIVLELGGKSANIILPDAELESAVRAGVARCLLNAGQSCQAPSRMLVHRSQIDTVLQIAKEHAEAIVIGPPDDVETQMGPLANAAQFEKVQGLIAKAIEEGATLVCGGPGRPDEQPNGYYVRPTIFSDVQPSMAIAQQEVFGPVLSIMTYESEDEAIALANSTSYGLAGYVQSSSSENARRVARRIRAGRIYINGAPSDRGAPMGGYRQSGLGREHGIFGFEEFLEIKSMIGAR